jgi:hypothetical protein
LSLTPLAFTPAHFLVKLEFASRGDWRYAFRHPFLNFPLILDPVVSTLHKTVLEEVEGEVRNGSTFFLFKAFAMLAFCS